jgi:single-strand DNA-binding protein
MSVQNNCTILGNIGRVETRYTGSGIPVTSLSIAVNEREKVNGQWEDVTTWFPCTLWQHENILNYLQPGKQVAVTARFKTRKYEDKEGQQRTAHEFVISDIKLLGGKKDGGNDDRAEPTSRPRGGSSVPSGPSKPSDIGSEPGISDDDIPFIREAMIFEP